MGKLKRDRAVSRELLAVIRQEQKLQKAALRSKPAAWKEMLESKLPDKVFGGLESAFCKGFSTIFSQGKGIIELGFNKDSVKADHEIQDFAFQRKGRRKELKQLNKRAKQGNLLTMTVTTVEGIGLGALGIGMPDIVLFLSNLLKGIYETALNYGFEYESKEEQILILKMMACALSSGEEWVQRNEEIDGMITIELVDATKEDLQRQINTTASVFAMDMLLMKFIQGLPIVGIIGGASNLVYYNKVMKYVGLKYRKRYLMKYRE